MSLRLLISKSSSYAPVLRQYAGLDKGCRRVRYRSWLEHVVEEGWMCVIGDDREDVTSMASTDLFHSWLTGASRHPWNTNMEEKEPPERPFPLLRFPWIKLYSIIYSVSKLL